MSHVPGYYYCDMCREKCPPSPPAETEVPFRVWGPDGAQHDYCGTECLLRAALSWVPIPERCQAVTDLMERFEGQTFVKVEVPK